MIGFRTVLMCKARVFGVRVVPDVVVSVIGKGCCIGTYLHFRLRYCWRQCISLWYSVFRRYIGWRNARSNSTIGCIRFLFAPIVGSVLVWTVICLPQVVYGAEDMSLSPPVIKERGSDNGSTADILMDDEEILMYINNVRKMRGIPLLDKSEALQKAAYNKALDMIASGYFAHYDPAGRAPWEWLDAVGYDYSYAGENLAIGFVRPAMQHAAWMDSETHRRNILNAEYTQTGIAVVYATIRGVREQLVVQFFARPQGAVAGVAPVRHASSSIAPTRSFARDSSLAIPANEREEHLWRYWLRIIAVLTVAVESVLVAMIISRHYRVWTLHRVAHPMTSV